MSDIEANAAQARRELALTDKAFAELSRRYMEEAKSAKTPEDAFLALRKLQGVESVQASLDAYLKTLEIEQAVQASKT